MSSADRVAHIDERTLMQLWAIHTLAPAEYKCLKSNKTEQSIYEYFAGFLF